MLIKAKPSTAKWRVNPIRHYKLMEDLWGLDRATGQGVAVPAHVTSASLFYNRILESVSAKIGTLLRFPSFPLFQQNEASLTRRIPVPGTHPFRIVPSREGFSYSLLLISDASIHHFLSFFYAILTMFLHLYALLEIFFDMRPRFMNYTSRFRLCTLLRIEQIHDLEFRDGVKMLNLSL
ncbi:hypothetical protein VNO80_18577 [Phaseolus coccineus]|uniref:Uncharacterized protein n=1 Tax=Phaseolus coccineus TaxID=3886 RepID=A0AAN9MJM4_PHACN